MEEQLSGLVTQTWEKLQKAPTSERLLIAISGLPGSGKTTFANLAVQRLNHLHANESVGSPSVPYIAACVPMDGFHLSRAQLSALPDPSNAHARRGAAFTFDSAKFLALVQKLRRPLSPESATNIYAPSFDHAVKDPVEDDIIIPSTARIIVFEGNYLSLGKGLWKEAAKLMDELWFMSVDIDTARRRLVKRHVKAGIARDEEDAVRRVEENDLVNGREILEFRLEVQEVVVSQEDGNWKD